MAPRNIEQNQLIKDERRDQILKAALKVFARRGLAATKISDITAEAGLSHGLVYHYFRSKDELFTELVKQALELSASASGTALQMPGNPWDKISAMTEGMLSHFAQNQEDNYYFLIMIQAATSDAVPVEVKELLAAKSMDMFKDMLKLIVMGQEAGQIVQDDPAALAMAFLYLIQGLAISQVPGKASLPIPKAETVLRLLKA